MGRVSGTAAALGGLVGYLDGGSIADTYATGKVSGSAIDEIGLIGLTSSNGTVSDSFFDTNTTGQISGVGSGPSIGVTGELTGAMKTESTYTDWNFTDTWGIDSGINYLRDIFSERERLHLPFHKSEDSFIYSHEGREIHLWSNRNG